MANPGEYWRNPYPEYERLRALGPIHWNEDLGTWIITGFPEAKAALVNTALSSCWLRGAAFSAVPAPVVEHVRNWLMWTDPPGHDLLRGELSTLFTARALAGYARDVESWTAEGYAKFVGRGGGDVVESFAAPLVTRIIAKVAGLEAVSTDALQTWSRAAGMLMAKPHHRSSAEEAARALEQLAEQISGLQPAEQTVIGKARTLDRRMTGSSALHLASLFTFAGIETTTQAVTRLVDVYLDGAFTRDRSSDAAVAELLRYDTPVLQVPRVVVSRARISGQTLEAGQAVLVMLGAANRDPRVFGAPALLSPRDDASRHLAFGHGRHRCIGAPLANLILSCTFESLRRHLRPRRVGTAEWHRERGYRGIARLIVGYDPAGIR